MKGRGANHIQLDALIKKYYNDLSFYVKSIVDLIITEMVTEQKKI